MRTKSPSKRLTESDRERIKEVADDFDEVNDRMRHALRGAEATVCAALAHQPDERTACFRHLSKACRDINASTRRCFRRQRRDATLITYRPPFRVHETCVLDAGGDVVAMFKTDEQILCGATAMDAAEFVALALNAHIHADWRPSHER
jgi:hypothetical protein